MRIAVAEALWVGQAELAEQHDRPLLGLGPARQAMRERRLDHLRHDPLGRVERRRRRLRDIGDLVPPELAQPAGAEFQDVAPADEDLAPGDAHAAAAIGERRQPDRRLAGAAFADEAEYLALVQRERDAVHDGDVLRRLARRIGRGLDLQVPDIDERISHRAPLSGCWCGLAPSPRRG